MSKSVEARWRSGLGFSVVSADGGTVELDGDEGTSGYRPTALLLASLAACTGMDVISVLRKKRQTVGRYEVVVSGHQRPDHPRTFDVMTVEHRVSGSNVDSAALVRAIELSATRYCPITAQLAQGDVTIKHRFLIEGASDPREGEVVVTGPHGRGLAPVPS
ncbi:OsmC family protein [soil metagenome]